ncbi:hypothetical protein C6496_10680 [Candidatus Poribacteria bacterium]|nr:MAG: hypothetical protein C6496_10680 [Candidatus Poribacteria bacterium]
MKMHVAQLTKQRLSDFFVKEDGHVAHKNALVAGTIATGAILASLMLAPEAAACQNPTVPCGGTVCYVGESCCYGIVSDNTWDYYCC